MRKRTQTASAHRTGQSLTLWESSGQNDVSGDATSPVMTYSQAELAPPPGRRSPRKRTARKVASSGAHVPITTASPGLPIRYFSHPNGSIWVGDAIAWLKTLAPASIDLVFADPPYNLKKAEWDTFESQQHYVEWSLLWIEEAARILKPTGSLYICGFSEILADLKLPASRYFAGCRWLVWHYKNKANLGHDWGRSHESILHFRKSKSFALNVDDVRIPYGSHTLKYPNHPQAITSQYGQRQQRDALWSPHPNGAKPRDVIEIPTTCNGMGEKTPHPTQKPEELLRKLVLASTSPDDLVIDPFVGSGTTAVVAEQLHRRWQGCDSEPQYCQWAAERIKHVPNWSVEEWMAYDQKNAERRKSIR